MTKQHHIAVYVPGKIDKQTVIAKILQGEWCFEALKINDFNTFIYTESTIDKFIDEEQKHDRYEIGTVDKTLYSMSEGEKKKALFRYFIRHPKQHIILDNVFDNLDHQSQKQIRETVAEIANTTIIVQLVNRMIDVLPFIEKIFSVEKDSLISIKDKDAFLQSILKKKYDHFYNDIPAALHTYSSIENPLVQLINVNVHYNENPIDWS